MKVFIFSRLVSVESIVLKILRGNSPFCPLYINVPQVTRNHVLLSIAVW